MTKRHPYGILLGYVLQQLKTQQEIDLFLNTFFTDTELKDIEKRLLVMGRLANGQAYTAIQKELKVSSATIAQVNAILPEKWHAKLIKWLAKYEYAAKLANPWRKRLR